MEENAPGSLEYILRIGQEHRELLGQVRHWDNLKIALHEGAYWLKGLTARQVASPGIKSIPYKEIFYLKDNKLFPEGSRLPVQRMPLSLLWTPVDRGLPLKLPMPNHNFFGLKETIGISIVPSLKEEQAVALLVTAAGLRKYIETAPAIRLKPLTWVIVGKDRAMIFGSPLLPMEGQAFWKKGSFLFPAGFDLEFPVLSMQLENKMELQGGLIVWEKDSTCFRVEKEAIKQLSIASFRRSVKQAGSATA
ncbi:MAG: hypothetical protein JWO09_2763 [Bacteroidetes bacterium]|nr:hypothetical protein [Bacteroidota bacterium]